ncbi:MAG: hypothetical protein J7647_27830 [Cyanobacteria bacterium SBLK]|nr:hypothetical protein [Cyanobacteria bacterium SBLK]
MANINNQIQTEEQLSDTELDSVAGGTTVSGSGSVTTHDGTTYDYSFSGDESGGTATVSDGTATATITSENGEIDVDVSV